MLTHAYHYPHKQGIPNNHPLCGEQTNKIKKLIESKLLSRFLFQKGYYCGICMIQIEVSNGECVVCDNG